METELKLDLAWDDLPALREALAAGDGVDRTLTATYHDTPRDDLRAAGFTLRVRFDGATYRQTVKAEGGVAAGLFARPEWERTLPDDRPVVDAAAGPIAAIVAGRPLVPRFVTHVRRTERTIEVGGAHIAVALDEGEVRAGEARLPLAELELELRDGPVASLFAYARTLDEVAPLRLGILSKAERGHRLGDGTAGGDARAEPIALDAEGDVGAAFVAIAQACLRHFRLNEAILFTAADPGPAPLHQARVALRRLRSAFALFKPLLGEDGQALRFAAELRALAGALGAVRDLDVLIDRYEGATRERLVAARAQAFGAARTTLEAPVTRRLMLDLAEWLAAGDWRLHATEPLLPFAADLLRRRRKRLKRRGRHLVRLDDHHRHRIRIEAKKLRYAAEFFASLWTGKKARRRRKAFLRAIGALQERLGHLNDAAAATATLDRLGIAAAAPAVLFDRDTLLAETEDAYEELIEGKRFWR